MSVSSRVEALLAKMTLEEKVAQTDMIRGVTLATRVHPMNHCAVREDSDFYWDRVDRWIGPRGIGFVHDVYSIPKVLNRLQRYFVEKTRLGIPCIFTGEALHGVSWPGASIFPMPIGLGAAFDPELTQEIGHAIAAETRALGLHEILAPNLDVARDPRWGRMEETFGEDTYLSSRMAKAIVSGEQNGDISRPDSVAAEPKHYLAYGFPEAGLNCAPARAGQREILSEYLPVFEAGVVEGGAYNLMCSYTSIDGQPVVSSHRYLTEIAKEKMGLRGYIRSDFNAINHLRILHRMTDNDADSIRLAVKAGMDVSGFDYSNETWENTLADLVRSGRVDTEVLDNAVRRILRVKFELGLFDHPYTEENHYRSVIRCQEHKDVSLRAAEESMVLLKNDGILPLKKDIRSVALVGPCCMRQRVGSYSSAPYGYEVPSVYEELKALLPNAEIRQEEGCNISEQDIQLVPPCWLEGGVHLSYYADGDFAKAPIAEDVFAEINFNWCLAKPHSALPFTGYAVRMTGILNIDSEKMNLPSEFDGTLIFPVRDSIRVYMDDALLIDSWGDKKQRIPSAPFHFVDGTKHAFTVEYLSDDRGLNVAFKFSPLSDDSMDRAVHLAKNADLTILLCGDDPTTSGEGMDRCSLQLYGRQRELIQRVSELGKPTVLVLEVGKPVDLTDENDNMNAILVPWFGGELGARAIARALVGDVNPSGHLPISFARNVGTLPCYYTMLPGGTTRYLECPHAPLYPFGHGLSYTTFEMHDIACTVLSSTEAELSITVSNTGMRDGVTVPQIYVEDIVSSVITPDKRLCAFERVHLKAGESKRIAFRLNERAFRLLNADLEWVVEPGDFVLHAGFSSADIREHVRITLK